MSNQLEQQKFKELRAQFSRDLTAFEPRINSLIENTPLTLSRLKAICQNTVSRNPKLLECTPASLFGAILTACELGLEPNTPNQFCAIVPYKTKVGNNYVDAAQLQMMYYGIVELAYRTERVIKIWTELVYEGDEFTEILGSNPQIIHKRSANPDVSKQPIAVYAMAKLDNGETMFSVIYKGGIDKVEKIIEKRINKPDAQYQKKAWAGFSDNDFNFNLWRKTAIKQLAKTLPKSAKSKLADAIKLDNQQPIINIDLETGEVIEEVVMAEEVKETENIKPSI